MNFDHTHYQTHTRNDGILDAMRLCFSKNVAGAVVGYCHATSQENKDAVRRNYALRS